MGEKGNGENEKRKKKEIEKKEFPIAKIPWSRITAYLQLMVRFKSLGLTHADLQPTSAAPASEYDYPFCYQAHHLSILPLDLGKMDFPDLGLQSAPLAP